MEEYFSELALFELARLFPETNRRQAVMHSIAWKLTRDSSFQSVQCPGFSSRNLRIGHLYAGFDIRLLFEVSTNLMVWRIGGVATPSPTE